MRRTRGSSGHRARRAAWIAGIAVVIVGITASASGFAPLSMARSAVVGAILPPIRVGLAAELTGRQSELGVSMRNGVRMAAEEVNAAGGVSGRRIELLVEDDRGIPEGAQAVDGRLIDAGVVAIVGHLTSDQTVAGYEVTERRRTVLISPTAAAPILTGKRDLFFRTFPSADSLGRELADYVTRSRGVSRVGIIHDQDNSSYTVPFADGFDSALTRLGGKVTRRVSFRSNEPTPFKPLLDQLRESGADAVFVLASSADAGLIVQQVRLSGWTVPIFGPPWSQGDSLLQNGGKAAEGTELIVPYDLNSPVTGLREFKARYRERFASDPIFSGMFGYETMRVLAIALERTGGGSDGLPQALESLGDYDGLAGRIHLDEFGDIMRPLYVQRVIDGRFETVATLRTMP